MRSTEHPETTPPTTDEFLGYLDARPATHELADQLSWILARRHAVAHAERRLAS